MLLGGVPAAPTGRGRPLRAVIVITEFEPAGGSDTSLKNAIALKAGPFNVTFARICGIIKSSKFTVKPRAFAEMR